MKTAIGSFASEFIDPVILKVARTNLQTPDKLQLFTYEKVAKMYEM